jgi:tetratricopeptide (TPR) repeat protein
MTTGIEQSGFYSMMAFGAFDSVIRGLTGFYYLVVWALMGVTVVGAQEVLPSCLSASGEAAVIACRRELNLAPNDLDIRFALSDALIGLKRHREAVAVLKEALEQSPGSNRIKNKLSLAESYLEEQSWIEKRRAQQATPSGATVSKKPDTETKLNIIRCTKLKGDSALKACAAALAVLPNDPSLRRSKADALMEMNKVVEAILAYQESLRLDPHDAEISKKLSAAQSKRKAFVAECQRLAGSAALRACNAALLEGATDEFDIHRRRGDLLLEKKRKAEAQKAYQRALELRPDDLAVKKKLNSLSEPVTFAKVDNTKSIRRESTPQEPVPVLIPAEPPTRPLPIEKGRETPASIQTARQAAEEDSSATHLPSTPPFLPSPKRYSNRPPVAGITH